MSVTVIAMGSENEFEAKGMGKGEGKCVGESESDCKNAFDCVGRIQRASK